MQVSVHLGDVKKVIKAYSIEVSAASKNDLKQVSPVLRRSVTLEDRVRRADAKQDEIVQRLRRAGGANYDRSKFD